MAFGGVAVRHEAASAGVVRHAIADALAAESVARDSIDDVVLVASELVGNAVRHADAPRDEALDVDWRIDGGDVVVGVTDGSPAMPRPRSTDDRETGGRGLAIVAAISDDWGVERTDRGKHVWARVHIERAAAPGSRRQRASAG